MGGSATAMQCCSRIWWESLGLDLRVKGSAGWWHTGKRTEILNVWINKWTDTEALDLWNNRKTNCCRFGDLFYALLFANDQVKVLNICSLRLIKNRSKALLLLIRRMPIKHVSIWLELAPSSLDSPNDGNIFKLSFNICLLLQLRDA